MSELITLQQLHFYGTKEQGIYFYTLCPLEHPYLNDIGYNTVPFRTG